MLEKKEGERRARTNKTEDQQKKKKKCKNMFKKFNEKKNHFQTNFLSNTKN